MQSLYSRRWAIGIMAAAAFKPKIASAEEITKREYMSKVVEDIKAHPFPEKNDTKQQFERIPRVVPFVDWDYYYIDGTMLWKPNPGQNGAPVILPKWFVTDLASVPSGLWSIYPPTGRYAYAAIVHDYLYWFQDRSREDADHILAAAMADAKVPSATINTFYVALRAAGKIAWESNKKARESGEKRVLAKVPDDPLISWADWRSRPGVFKP
jgi:hypothetical protein